MVDNPATKFVSMQGRDPEEAQFFWTGGPVQVADRTWFASAGSGTTAFETDDGLVLIDSGTRRFSPILSQRIREKTDAPIHTAIFTHGHIDHAFGLTEFLAKGQRQPRVIAHRAMPSRFKRYDQTPNHNRAINARQFGGSVDRSTFEVDGDLAFGTPRITPDILYDDKLNVEVGGLTFHLRHARGETDDSTWIYCPEREVLNTGDLMIWGVPNAGNPQKVQRYPWDWAVALREMASLNPRSLCPGHGGPVVDDPGRIQSILLETAAYLESIVDQTIAALEDGSPPHVDIVRSIDVPRSDSPWLQPIYDEAEFIARNIIRYYGGWWTGRPSELKPSPRSEVANAICGLAGSPGELCSKALEIAERDLRLACHLADYALEAAPDDADVQTKVAELYERRAESEEGLMTANIFISAATYARAGRPFA